MVYTLCHNKVVGLHKTHGDNFVNFLKLVRQHTKGMVGSIIYMLLKTYFSLLQWKNFENPLRNDKVTVTSLV